MEQSSFEKSWNRTFRNYLQFFLLLKSESSQASIPAKREYLRFLAAKKQEQINRIYDMAASHKGLVKMIQLYNTKNDPRLATLDLFAIFDYVWNRTEQEIESYTDSLHREPNGETRLFMHKILDMLHDFSADAKIGYLTNTSKELARAAFEDVEAPDYQEQEAEAIYSSVAG